jgi:hypothetical protein
MGAETIHGKVDSGHHDGKASEARKLGETDDQMNRWFEDSFGIPFSYAVTMSKWDNPTGAHWKHVLEYLASETDLELQESKTSPIHTQE